MRGNCGSRFGSSPRPKHRAHITWSCDEVAEGPRSGYCSVPGRRWARLPGDPHYSCVAAVERIFFQFAAALAMVPAWSFWNMRKISSLRNR